MNPCLIINRAAGSSKAATAAFAAAAAAGLPTHETAAPEEAERAARAAVERGDERLIVAGGDGTLHAVLSALAGSATALGAIPCGRGNDLARALGLPRDPLEAFTRALNGRRRQIDLGRWGTRRFAGALSLGLDAAVADRVRRRRNGSAAIYGYEALRMLWRFRPQVVGLTIDRGQHLERRLWLAAVANSGIYGGGMRIAPDASLDDGGLDLVMLHDTGRLRLTRLLPAVYRGTHVADPSVEIRRVTRVELLVPAGWSVFADGEPLERPPDGRGLVAVDPGALHVIV